MNRFCFVSPVSRPACGQLRNGLRVTLHAVVALLPLAVAASPARAQYPSSRFDPMQRYRQRAAEQASYQEQAEYDASLAAYRAPVRAPARTPAGRRPQSVAMRPGGPQMPIEPEFYDEMPPEGMAPGPGYPPYNVYGPGMHPNGFPPGDGYVDNGCDSCKAWGDSCCRREGGLWARADYLLWWTAGWRVPALVTTSPDDATNPGVLDSDGTVVLFGDEHLHDDVQSGVRLSVGTTQKDGGMFGIEASYLALEGESSSASFTGDRFPILARPFFDVTAGQESALVVASPTLGEGFIDIDASTDFQMSDVVLRRTLSRCCGNHVDFLVGYRFARLDDDLSIHQFSPGGIDEDLTSESRFDQFETQNEFHGAQAGFSAGMHRCRWSMDMLLKLALGVTQSRVAINGETVTTPTGGTPVVTSGGLLAQPSNIGERDDNHFSVMPEIGLGLGYDISRNLKVRIGYSLVYWSRVARPGDQIDLNVDATQSAASPGSRPEAKFVTDDFWAQGTNFGLEYSF